VFFDRLVERERLFNIESDRFKPRPDVVSTSFRLTRREQPLFPVSDEGRFRQVVKACFCQRRKTIANNLVAGLGLARSQACAALSRAGIEPSVRAETVAGRQFSALAEALPGAGSRGDAGPD
jgi:16S rRNA (adenine1518-N6/adenine1519-N6)-dimethyltransferase